MKSIIDYLEAAAEHQPDSLLYAFLNATGDIVDSYTYRQFHERTNYMAECLRHSVDLQSGQPVVLVYPSGLEFAAAFFACVKVGALPVPVPAMESASLVGTTERLSGITQDCGATIALTTQDHLNHMHATASRNVDVAAWLTKLPVSTLKWCPTDTMRGTRSDFETHRNSLLFLQYTSGSTQAPRGVMVSHANVLHNCFATVDHSPLCISWLPHYHDMGLIGCLLFPMLLGGSSYLFSSSNFLRRPRLWFEAITRYRGTASSAPNFAYEYCLRDDRMSSDVLAGLDLSSVRVLLNGAEPVRAGTYQRFLKRFEPCGLSRNAFRVYYGLAENTLSVTGGGRVQVSATTHFLEQGQLRLASPRTNSSIGSDQTHIVSCGAPVSGVEVRIVDVATSQMLGEDLIGEVWVAGESKTEGYWNNPALTQKLFFSTMPDATETNSSYLRTGDLGFMHDGELFVCGRIKDVIISGGRNYYASDIEAVVESASTKVRQGCVAAFGISSEHGEDVVVLLEVRRPNDLPDLNLIAREVQRRCHLEVDVLIAVPHGTVSKTSSGKIARQECRKHWQQGKVQSLARRDRLTPRLGNQDVVYEFLARLDTEQDSATLAEIGADSLTLVELCLLLEKVAKERGVFDAEFFDLRALQSVTVGEVKKFLIQTNNKPFMRSMYLRRLRSIESNESSRMRRDAKLPTDIRANIQTHSAGNKVLLTGATGFLGSFLLEALLRQTDFEIVAVARSEDRLHARSRVESALHRTGLWCDTLRHRFERRVTAITGDLAHPRIGLDEREWDRLIHELSGIYHCGGEVDYVKPYQSLHDPNVSSTLALLRLTTQGSRKVLHHISTTFIFGFAVRDVCEERDVNSEMAGLNFGYAQTKWVSEQLVHEAIRRGIPARVYRPSFVTASRMGRYVRRDVLTRIFTYMIQYGVAPDSRNQVSCLPVDVCANNIAALSLLDHPSANTFHLTADHYYSIRSLCESMTRQYGYSFGYMNLERLILHINQHCQQNDPVFPLMPFLNHNFRRIDAMSEKRYASQAYQHSRKLSSNTLAEPGLDEVVAGLVTFLQQERMAPVVARNQVLRNSAVV